MTELRQHGKCLLFVISAVLIWAQYFTTQHDQNHYHAGDDCRVCKLVENASDKPSVEEFLPSEYVKSEIVDSDISEIILIKNRWETSLSRAPPIS